MNDTDKKWVKALSSVSKQVEAAGSGYVEIYDLADGDDDEAGTVDAEATLRHFLEVTCNIRVQPDHSQHKVPTGPPKGHDAKVGGVIGANQAPNPAPRTRFAR